ncbi:MAG: threonylcarbamoyl-AMP synthase [Burkholderiales bacterium]|nr:threonylcarbamoyl-AMP synthase [Burkholderiales bacterium]
MTATVVSATADAIDRAAGLLARGALVAFPTETVYGLGADAANPEAVRAIFTAKGRPSDHPLIVHLPDASHLDAWARDVPAGARALARAFWPGPLTLILPRTPLAGDTVTGGQDTVGLRVPAHPVARALLAAFAARGGHGVAAPSANRYGHVSPTTAAHVADDLGAQVAMILDGGPCAVGIESTIVAFDGEAPLLVRPGGVGADAIARVLGLAPAAATAGAPRASGTHASHYAPRTAAFLVDARSLPAELVRLAERDEAVAVLARSLTRPPEFEGRWIEAPGDVDGYARDLYANLRALDAAGADAILIEAPPLDAAWLAVRDRLARATHRD